MTRRFLPGLAAVALTLVACSDDVADTSLPKTEFVGDPPLEVFDTATEPTSLQRIEFELHSVLDRGTADVYAFVDGELRRLSTLAFHSSPFRNYAQYESLESTTNSHLLIRIRGSSALVSEAKELYCFSRVRHQVARHTIAIHCDMASTMTFYMSAEVGSPSPNSPFEGIDGRLSIWESYSDASDSDLTAFLISALATIENALLGLGPDKFDRQYRPVRRIMEPIAVNLLDGYQVDGFVLAGDLIDFIRNSTGDEIPIGRLLRFASIFEQYRHVEPVDIHDSGGSLTRRTRRLQLSSLTNELERFFLLGSPLEMSDYRTHLVQNVVFDRETGLLSWDALPHMYGYNVYVDGLHVGYTNTSRIMVDLPEPRSGTIKAVGHAGEFGGVEIRFSDRLIADAMRD